MRLAATAPATSAKPSWPVSSPWQWPCRCSPIMAGPGPRTGSFKLTGIIRAVYVGNPHATLDVDAEGELWRVELAPPSATIRAGFTEDAAKAGDEVVAIGNRSRDPGEKRMKAVRIIVNGKTYDVYPGRVPPA